MKLRRQDRQFAKQAVVAFTMLEIALCLGIIGISLVAIIGIMPTGMQVQRENREDTQVLADGQALIDAIRTGNTNNAGNLSSNIVWLEAYTNNVLAGSYNYPPGTGPSSAAIIGVLSTPKYTTVGGVIITNVVRVKFVANNGALALQSTNSRSLAFGYVVTPEIVPFYPSYATNNVISNSITTNLFDVRLTVQWPVFGNHSVGAGGETFRTIVSGQQTTLTDTNTGGLFYYFRPNYY